jgi:hypothetical protein
LKFCIMVFILSIACLSAARFDTAAILETWRSPLC